MLRNVIFIDFGRIHTGFIDTYSYDSKSYRIEADDGVYYMTREHFVHDNKLMRLLLERRIASNE